MDFGTERGWKYRLVLVSVESEDGKLLCVGKVILLFGISAKRVSVGKKCAVLQSMDCNDTLEDIDKRL